MLYRNISQVSLDDQAPFFSRVFSSRCMQMCCCCCTFALGCRRFSGSGVAEAGGLGAAFVVVDCVLQVANADAAARGSRWVCLGVCVPGCVWRAVK